MIEILRMFCSECRKRSVMRVFKTENNFIIQVRKVESSKEVETEYLNESRIAQEKGDSVKAAKLLARHSLKQKENIRITGFQNAFSIKHENLNKICDGYPEKGIMLMLPCECSATVTPQISLDGLARLIRMSEKAKKYPVKITYEPELLNRK